MPVSEIHADIASQLLPQETTCCRYRSRMRSLPWIVCAALGLWVTWTGLWWLVFKLEPLVSQFVINLFCNTVRMFLFRATVKYLFHFTWVLSSSFWSICRLLGHWRNVLSRNCYLCTVLQKFVVTVSLKKNGRRALWPPLHSFDHRLMQSNPVITTLVYTTLRL